MDQKEYADRKDQHQRADEETEVKVQVAGEGVELLQGMRTYLILEGPAFQWIIADFSRPTALLRANLLVFFHFSVTDVDNAMRVHGDVVFVRHQHNGVAFLVQFRE
jgi:hypothetical protein